MPSNLSESQRFRGETRGPILFDPTTRGQSIKIKRNFKLFTDLGVGQEDMFLIQNLEIFIDEKLFAKMDTLKDRKWATGRTKE